MRRRRGRSRRRRRRRREPPQGTKGKASLRGYPRKIHTHLLKAFRGSQSHLELISIQKSSYLKGLNKSARSKRGKN
jgi:hypothetical protein